MDLSFLHKFIVRFSKKIANTYPSCCVDEEDYIQEGYLKLIQINKSRQKKRNFEAYAIIAIANTIRNFAIDMACTISASTQIKRQIQKINKLSTKGKTEAEICKELNIAYDNMNYFRTLTDVLSLDNRFNEPQYNQDPFCIITDVLSLDILTEDEKRIILSRINGETSLNTTTNWRKRRDIFHKLARSGYGI